MDPSLYQITEYNVRGIRTEYYVHVSGTTPIILRIATGAVDYALPTTYCDHSEPLCLQLLLEKHQTLSPLGVSPVFRHLDSESCAPLLNPGARYPQHPFLRHGSMCFKLLGLIGRGGWKYESLFILSVPHSAFMQATVATRLQRYSDISPSEYTSQVQE
jgi:hypothetical protein